MMNFVSAVILSIATLFFFIWNANFIFLFFVLGIVLEKQGPETNKWGPEKHYFTVKWYLLVYK
jgi:hypothetical protein